MAELNIKDDLKIAVQAMELLDSAITGKRKTDLNHHGEYYEKLQWLYFRFLFFIFLECPGKWIENRSDKEIAQHVLAKYQALNIKKLFQVTNKNISFPELYPDILQWNINPNRYPELITKFSSLVAFLQPEDLGRILELFLATEIDSNSKSYKLRLSSGEKCKSTGSYYTPDSLIQYLLDETLEPVIETAYQTSNRGAALLLNLRICDPACGCGYFLLPAARRIADRLSSKGKNTTRRKLAQVIQQCIYGVDINPLAVFVCKLALWLETGLAENALASINENIRIGNSLLGTTKQLMHNGIPPEAFQPGEQDDPTICVRWKRKNKAELLQFNNQMNSYPNALAADAWCASFFCRKAEGTCPITASAFQRLENISYLQQQEMNHLARQHQFFHWELEFSQVFQNSNGFDVIVGNPPYGIKTTRKERNFFRFRYPHARETANSSADFLELSHGLLKPGGRLGLILPKSLTFSHDWRLLRDWLFPQFRVIIDAGKSWSKVLLEQAIYVVEKTGNTAPQKLKTGQIIRDQLQWNKSPQNHHNPRLGILLTGLGDEDCKLLEHILNNSSMSLEKICSTSRGTNLQKYTRGEGEIGVIGGKNLSSFISPIPTRFLEHSATVNKSIRYSSPHQVAFQNIIAHITKPASHIKLIGTILPKRYACLDTVNLLSIHSSFVTPLALAGYLMSDLINWFVYVGIYNRAIRTMHFDNYFLKKIPIPKKWESKILQKQAERIWGNPKKLEGWYELNQVVYDHFKIPISLRKYVESQHKPRWES